jgi:uncharacterized protein (DUF2235 family)
LCGRQLAGSIARFVQREGPAVAKNIVLLSDGTGNSSAKLQKTNVWRLYQALDLNVSDAQVAFYDNGVGTSSFKLFAALGGIFGFGLKRNIIDIYSFCCRNYVPGDQLYGFGFSRGAFTIRIVAGFIARMGLVQYNGCDTDLARDAETAYRAYRKARGFRSGFNFLVAPVRAIRDFFAHTILRKPRIEDIARFEIEKFHFLGVWDTVSAYGGPIEEITLAIDYWLWPLSMPDSFMSRKITRACHVLALDEERDAFKPVLWDDRYVRGAGDRLHSWDQGWSPEPQNPDGPLTPIDRERISQVWFVGVHCDIGGGYPQDGLSYFTLKWMMERAHVYGLRYLAPQEVSLTALANPYDKLNDSRHGVAGYYRYRPRNLLDLYDLPAYRLSLWQDFLHILRLIAKRPDPENLVKAELAPGTAYRTRPPAKIHQTVFDRISRGNDGYAPIVLPQRYDVVSQTGDVTLNVATPAGAQEAASRAARQGKVWDWVWIRRVIYFLSVFASLYLLALPIIDKASPGPGAGSRYEFVIPIIDVIGTFLPNVVKPWLDAFRHSPGRFLLGIVLIFVFMYFGAWAQTHLRDVMRRIWRTPGAEAPHDRSLIYRVRSAGLYRAFFYLLKHWISPSIFAVLFLFAALLSLFYLANRISFAWFDHRGHVCAPGQPGPPLTGKSAEKRFETKAICTSTELQVEKGKTYQVVITLDAPWEDGYKLNEPNAIKAKGIETGPDGFGFDKMTWRMWFGLPIRRELGANWFAAILRIGDKGSGEIGLTFERVDALRPQPGPMRYKAQFKARRSGEVFVYVNDSVLGWPGYFDYFYQLNNKGDATISLELVPDDK